jgi:hypothetical protein
LGNNAGTFGINTDLNYTGGDQGFSVAFSGGTVNAGNFTYPTSLVYGIISHYQLIR